MLSGVHPVRSNPIRRARSGNPPWSFTRLSRSSPQANTTRPSSMNETVESLSSGLMPRTRMSLNLTPRPPLRYGERVFKGESLLVIAASLRACYVIRSQARGDDHKPHRVEHPLSIHGEGDGG